jgi:prophage antirepressor-like protein
VSHALSRLDDDEKNTIVLNEGIGNPLKATVNEYGLLNLTLTSRKPEAKEFRRWVTHEVLPSTRKKVRIAETQLK